MATTPASSATALTFRSASFDVVDHSGQPWLKAADIARALGYAREDAISRVYERNASEFTAQMCQTVKLTVSRNGGDLLNETRIFSLRGAHLLAMFARTELAAEFRKWVLDVLEHGTLEPVTPRTPYSVTLHPTLSAEQADSLRSAMTMLAAKVPKDAQGKFMAQGWSKLKSHFGAPYREIPAGEFGEAMSIVTRHFADFEVIDAQPQPTPAPVFEPWSQWDAHVDDRGRWVFSRAKTAEERMAGLIAALNSPGGGGWSPESLLPLLDAIHGHLSREARRIVALHDTLARAGQAADARAAAARNREADHPTITT